MFGVVTAYGPISDKPKFVPLSGPQLACEGRLGTRVPDTSFRAESSSGDESRLSVKVLTSSEANSTRASGRGHARRAPSSATLRATDGCAKNPLLSHCRRARARAGSQTRQPAPLRRAILKRQQQRKPAAPSTPLKGMDGAAGHQSSSSSRRKEGKKRGRGERAHTQTPDPGPRTQRGRGA